MLIRPFILLVATCCLSSGSGQTTSASETSQHVDKRLESNLDRQSAMVDNSSISTGLEPRISDRNFIKDIVDRLHALDADIGKLLYNSTSMYSLNDQNIVHQDSPFKGGEKFTEVLDDLDSLQDEIGAMIQNATRTRQYNMLVRLRPLNNLLYRIRNNLHLMRNSLVAINAVSNLEKIGNTVLDSTLSAFLRPEANLSEEVGDDGNYDFNLDKPEHPPSSTTSTTVTSPLTTTTTTTTTPSPPSSSASTTTIVASSTTVATTAASTTAKVSANITLTRSSNSTVSTTKRPTQRPTRRGGQRQNQRRTTQKPSSTTQANDDSA